MAGKQAKILSDTSVESLLIHASASRYPERNCVIVLLSVKAGLRAAEIAKLRWEMVLDPDGDVGPAIELQDAIAKKGSGRIIPIHPELREALRSWLDLGGGFGEIVRSERGEAMQPIGIVNWVCQSLSVAGARWLLIPFRAQDFHHARCTAGSPGRRLVARCAAAGRSSIHSNHATIHRRGQ